MGEWRYDLYKLDVTAGYCCRFSHMYAPCTQISIYQNGELVKTLTVSATTSGEPSPQSTVGRSDHDELKRGHQTYRLEDLAFLRSGDKGDSANIG